MTDKCVDLRPDRDLLDANFDGYKLSLDALPVYKLSLSGGLDEVKLTEEQYSVQHIKAFGLNNYLACDPWNPHLVFFIDSDWHIKKVTVQLETCLDAPVTLLQLPDAPNQKLRTDRHNVSLQFVDEEWALVADGAGKLLLIHTGDRKQDKTWKVHFNDSVLGEKAFILQYGVMYGDNETQKLGCVLLYVEKSEQKEEKGRNKPFVTVLSWLTLMSENKQTWAVDRERYIEGYSSPDYVVLDSKNTSLIVSAESPFKITHDSMKPLQEPKAEEHRPMEPAKPRYLWMQSEEDVSITFVVPEETAKADILFKLTADNIDLGIKNSDVLLRGLLHARVDVESSTWTLSNRELEVTLIKESPGMWSALVLGDSRGQLVLDDDQRQRVQEQLSHLTSSTWNPDFHEDNKPAYNSEQLEECDALPDDMSTMQRFDGESHQITHQVNLGSHQWLFNTRRTASKPSAICLRHDVDGIVWQPREEFEPKKACWDHIATFNAFGYVQASKRQRKFTSCPPGFSYVALCDAVRHVYVYWQPSPTLSPLRNRKTGREVSAVAKQQVVSIESIDPIMGLQATDERLFVMTAKVLYIVRMSNE